MWCDLVQNVFTNKPPNSDCAQSPGCNKPDCYDNCQRNRNDKCDQYSDNGRSKQNTEKPSRKLRRILLFTVVRTSIMCSGKSVVSSIPRATHVRTDQKRKPAPPSPKKSRLTLFVHSKTLPCSCVPVPSIQCPPQT